MDTDEARGCWMDLMSLFTLSCSNVRSLLNLHTTYLHCQCALHNCILIDYPLHPTVVGARSASIQRSSSVERVPGLFGNKLSQNNHVDAYPSQHLQA